MKLKFNYYTSHLLFVTISYVIMMFANFMMEKWVSGTVDFLIVGVWYWNYAITLKSIERYEELGQPYPITGFMKGLCVLILVLNAFTLSVSPLSIFYPFIFLMAIYEAYSILVHKKVVERLKDWLKR